MSLYESLLHLRIFATPDAAQAAEYSYSATYAWGAAQMEYEGDPLDRDDFLVSDEYEERHDQTTADLLKIIRRDLGVFTKES